MKVLIIETIQNIYFNLSLLYFQMYSFFNVFKFSYFRMENNINYVPYIEVIVLL